MSVGRVKNHLFAGHGDSIVWNVQRSGPDYIQTIVNAQGERKYTTDPGYLGELTADAFLVNEYTDGNQFKTYIGVDVRGNKNVKEVALIPADGKSIPVENHGKKYTTEVTGYHL